MDRDTADRICASLKSIAASLENPRAQWVHPLPPMAEGVRLVGGFYCVLTPSERNAWSEYVQTLPTYGLLRRIREHKIEDHDLSKTLEAESVLFQIAREWYAKLRAMRPEAKDE